MFDYIVGQFQVIEQANETAIVSWSYLNKSNGQLFGPNSLLLPSAAEEYWLLESSGTLVYTLSQPADNVHSVVCWIVGSKILGKYFYSGELPPLVKLPELKLPKSRSEQWTAEKYFQPTRTNGGLIHYEGTNYPGPQLAAGTKVRYKSSWPGFELSPAGIEITNDELNLNNSQITEALLAALVTDLQSQELACQNYWQSYFDNNQGNLNFWGYDRKPWSGIFKIAPELSPEFTLRSLPNQAAFTQVFVWQSEGFHSVGAPTNWHFSTTSVVIPCDSGVRVLNLKGQTIAQQLAAGPEGTNFVIASLTVQRTAPKFVPTNDLSSFAAVPAVSALPEGQNYRFPGGNLVYKPQATIPTRVLHADYAHRKLHASSFHHAADLAKLNRGFGLKTNTIKSELTDLTTPLRLWNLPAFVLGTSTCGTVLGHDDARVCVRVPLHYARSGPRWQLAEALAKTFLPVGLFEYGYHEFACDISTAGEAIYQIQPENFGIRALSAAIVEGTRGFGLSTTSGVVQNLLESTAGYGIKTGSGFFQDILESTVGQGFGLRTLAGISQYLIEENSGFGLKTSEMVIEELTSGFGVKNSAIAITEETTTVSLLPLVSQLQESSEAVGVLADEKIVSVIVEGSLGFGVRTSTGFIATVKESN